MSMLVQCRSVALAEFPYLEGLMAGTGRYLKRIAQAIEGVDAAIVGAFGVASLLRPRMTIDVDVLVRKKDVPRIKRSLAAHGYGGEVRDDAWAVLDGDVKVGDLLIAEHHPLWLAVLEDHRTRAPIPGIGEGPTLDACGHMLLKYFAAISPSRPPERRKHDAGDLLALMRVAWDRIDGGERRRLAELIHTGAADALEAIHADLVAGRPIRL